MKRGVQMTLAPNFLLVVETRKRKEKPNEPIPLSSCLTNTLG